MHNKIVPSMVLGILLALTAGVSRAQTDEAEATPSEPARGVAEQKAPNVPELRNQANQAYAEGDHETFRNAMLQLRQARPYNSEYMYLLALAHALLDEKTPAYDVMLTMQRQGLSYDFNQTDDSTNIRGTQLYDYVNDLMVRAGQPAGSAPLAFELPTAVNQPQAITWDATREAFLVGTITEGVVFQVDRDGSTKELLRADGINGLWGIYDLLVDVKRNRLWVCTAANERFVRFEDVDRGRSALLEFDLSSLELKGRYPIPVDGLPHSLGSMTQTPSGDIFVVDRTLPIVFVKSMIEDRIAPLFMSSNMVSLRDITSSPNGKKLYVADYEMGISVIDLETQDAGFVRVPANLNLGGIEGLNYWKGHLVVVQNGIKPQRVMRLKLNDAGDTITNTAPLAVALDSFDYPSHGVVVGNDLVFYASSYWNRDPAAGETVTVLRTDIAGGQDIVPPDVQKFREDMERDGRVAPLTSGPEEASSDDG